MLSCWFTAVWGLGGCLGGSSIIGRGRFSKMGEEGGSSIIGGRIYFESGGNADSGYLDTALSSALSE